jgi:hypothetical protein
MARTTAQLEGWIVRDTTAGVPAGSNGTPSGTVDSAESRLEAARTVGLVSLNHFAPRVPTLDARDRSSECGGHIQVVSSIGLTTQRVIRF